MPNGYWYTLEPLSIVFCILFRGIPVPTNDINLLIILSQYLIKVKLSLINNIIFPNKINTLGGVCKNKMGGGNKKKGGGYKKRLI